MERYTRKDIYQEGYELEGCGCQGDYMPINDNIPDIIDRLGKLEDIEEELGCPLEVIIKALTRGVYVVDEQTKEIQCILRGLTTFTGAGLDTNYSGFIDERTWRKKVLYKGIEMPPMYYWKDYKKTWWLNKDKSE